jgi:hypothetical protein
MDPARSPEVLGSGDVGECHRQASWTGGRAGRVRLPLASRSARPFAATGDITTEEVDAIVCLFGDVKTHGLGEEDNSSRKRR